MTLCVGWVRQAQEEDGQELVFATDSRLKGGETWDSGIKLFDLNRPDCLICFAGSTGRAYPLIIRGGFSGRFNVDWTNPRLDLHDVLDIVCRLFTDLCSNITDLGTSKKMDDFNKVEFLFGGWSWKKQRLCLWRVWYSEDANGFVTNSIHDEKPLQTVEFIGDHVQGANDRLIEETVLKHGMGRPLDAEPLQVLAQMSRERKYDEIGGALQVAKVYRSGTNEFFGVMWPSMKEGPHTFMGRSVNPYDSPPMFYLDPDTGRRIEGLPTRFADLETHNFGRENKFVQDCYSGAEKSLASLSGDQRARLIRVLKHRAFEEFVAAREAPVAEPLGEGNESSAS